MFSTRSALRPACRAPKRTAATASRGGNPSQEREHIAKQASPGGAATSAQAHATIIDAGPQHDADADQRDGEEAPFRRIEVRHDANERLVRLAGRLLNGADRSGA